MISRVCLPVYTNGVFVRSGYCLFVSGGRNGEDRLGVVGRGFGAYSIISKTSII